MVTSNLCAGSIGRLVFGSMGRFRLEYSASWTAFTTSNFSLRCFFSLDCRQWDFRRIKRLDLLSTFRSEHCSFPDILLAQHILVPPVDGFALVSSCFVLRDIKSVQKLGIRHRNISALRGLPQSVVRTT